VVRSSRLPRACASCIDARSSSNSASFMSRVVSVRGAGGVHSAHHPRAFQLQAHLARTRLHQASPSPAVYATL
jgi:hypothetical protein